MYWSRLLALTILGMALLLFRANHSDGVEIQDARGEIDSSVADDAAPIPSLADPEPARLEESRLATESPHSVSGYLFVSEIFRPPIAPLSPESMFDPKTRERRPSCLVRPCGRQAMPIAPVGYQLIHSS